MRITNWKHFPWFLFVCLATVAAGVLYLGNFHPQFLPRWIQLPPSLIQKPTEHHTVGGTPLGLAFGAMSLGIFVFAAALNLRKKFPLWRVGTVQRWLRAHIWLTFLTIPLIILHSGFRLGGPMTTLLMVLYAVVMVSGIYGLILQHLVPRLMKERLPAETVYEQIPHIRSQLCVAAEKMRDSFKPPSPKKTEATGAAAPVPKPAVTASAVMASTKGELSTPTARPKSATGSALTAAPVAKPAATASASVVGAAAKETAPGITVASAANAGAGAVARSAETVSVPAEAIPNESSVAVAPPPPKPEAAKADPQVAGDTSNVAEVAVLDPPNPSNTPSAPIPEGVTPAKSIAPAAAPVKSAIAPVKPAPKPAKPVPTSDPESERLLMEFIDRQILPYLRALRGGRFRLANTRFSDETFRLVKLGVSETYRARVEEIQGWCDERRLLDLQTRLHHWLHGWLIVHVPFSFLLLMLTIWHAWVTLFYY